MKSSLGDMTIDRGRESSMRRLLIVTVIALLPLCTVSLEVHKVLLGRDAVVNFPFAVSPHVTSFEYDFFTLDGNCIFCTNGDMNKQCLKPEQRERFTVEDAQIQHTGSFNVTLFIHNTAEIDIGVYLLTAREDNNGQFTNHIMDVYIDVILPPGKAECTVRGSPFSAKWSKVYCTATLGLLDDREGFLTCFQDSEKTPFFRSTDHSSTHVTGDLWMKNDLPINCCSYLANYEPDPDSCIDFMKYPVATNTPSPVRNIHSPDYMPWSPSETPLAITSTKSSGSQLPSSSSIPNMLHFNSGSGRLQNSPFLLLCVVHTLYYTLTFCTANH